MEAAALRGTMAAGQTVATGIGTEVVVGEGMARHHPTNRTSLPPTRLLRPPTVGAEGMSPAATMGEAPAFALRFLPRLAKKLHC